MILSHRHRFLFIKTGKTAGTSTEIALSQYCGPEDVLTPLSSPDERMRRGRGYVGAQNFRVPLAEYERSDWLALLRGRPAAFFNHIGAAEIRRRIPHETWQSVLKVAIERNPWDRAVSSYAWTTWRVTDSKPPIRDWLLDRGIDGLINSGRDLYTIDGEVVVDRVLRYERLEDDLAWFAAEVGLPGPLTLPRAKSGFRDGRHYREMLSDELRDLIAERFAPEIERFGYEF